MSTALDLVVLNGPREGEIVTLDPERRLPLGRSVRGYQLVDPFVSLDHAEIQWEGDCYWVEDLGSATGTFVNDVRVDKPVMVVPGMRIRLGETVLEVRNRPRSTLYRVAGGVAVVAIFLFALTQYRRSIVVEYKPRVVWYQPVNQGVLGASPVVDVPSSFIRTTGVDHRDLKIDRVTDYDADGIDELWLRWRTGRRVVTFADDGDWRDLGDVPLDCQDKPRVLDEALPAECYVAQNQIKTELPPACKRYGQVTSFPDLECSGTFLRMVDGAYQIIGLDGVVAWMDPTEKVKDEDASKKAKKDIFKANVLEGPPKPYLFAMARAGQLAGFLADRGVHEPVHYLVCEDAVPGIKPQVLTASGKIVQLGVGCLTDVDLTGPQRNAEFSTLRPKMLAFTGVGRARLLADLAIYFGGSEDPTAVPSARKALYNALTEPPLRRQGGVRLVFAGPEQLNTGVADERMPVVRDRLLPTEFAPPVPERVYDITLVKAGRYDLEGCSELEVRVTDWHCVSAKGCGADDAFMQIRNVGCGAGKPVVVPFAQGARPYNDGMIKGTVLVESKDSGPQIDVLRVRLSYGLVDAATGG